MPDLAPFLFPGVTNQNYFGQKRAYLRARCAHQPKACLPRNLLSQLRLRKKRSSARFSENNTDGSDHYVGERQAIDESDWGTRVSKGDAVTVHALGRCW